MKTYKLTIWNPLKEIEKPIAETKTIKEALKVLNEYDKRNIVGKNWFYHLEDNKGKNYTNKIYTY